MRIGKSWDHIAELFVILNGVSVHENAVVCFLNIKSESNHRSVGKLSKCGGARMPWLISVDFTITQSICMSKESWDERKRRSYDNGEKMDEQITLWSSPRRCKSCKVVGTCSKITSEPIAGMGDRAFLTEFRWLVTRRRNPTWLRFGASHKVDSH